LSCQRQLLGLGLYGAYLSSLVLWVKDKAFPCFIRSTCTVP
jgi:hypothetical protein